MLIKFWINDTDAFPMEFAANHIVAVQVVLYLNGAGEGAHDIIVHTTGNKYRFPWVKRNISARLDWETWVEGQK